MNARLLAGPGTYRAAGISTYIAGLLRHLPEAAPHHTYRAWVSRQWPGYPGVTQVAAGASGDRVAARVAWEQLALPGLARRAGVSLLHGPAFSVPLAAPCPTVLSVMDLTFMLFPQYHSPARRLYLSLITRLSLRAARAVIAISEQTKRDLCRLLRVPEQRVTVIPLGVEERFRPQPEPEVERFRAGKGLGRYIFYQGTIEPRKNLVRLVQAYALLRRQGRASHQLVIAGAPGWGYRQVTEAVAALDLTEHVAFAGYVAPDESPMWYAAADLFAFPSIYEGFGLPPLEAMACGTPVVAADSSSIPEVVGDAGVLVPPDDVEGLARAMSELLNDEERRRHLAAMGPARARRFTWLQAAKATAALYERCVA